MARTDVRAGRVSELNSRLALTTGVITPASGITFSWRYLAKSVGLVFLRIQMDSSYLTDGNYTTVGTIDEVFRPSVDYLSAVVANITNGDMVYIRVKTTGVIDIYKKAGVSTSGNIYIDCVYPAAT